MFDFISYDTKEKNVTPEYIDELEGKLNIKFPDILRKFYTNHNMAELAEFAFMIHDLEFSVEFIMPLLYGNMHVEKILSLNEDNKYIPKTFIPLAEDVDGENFYWDSSNGKVYYLSLENVENPIPICDSVERFFEILNDSYNARKEKAMIKYLPLGSIVLLKGGMTKILVVSRALNVRKGKEQYFFDYGGVMYPEGLVGDQMAYFNADKISRVVFEGYTDIDDENMVENINRYIEEHSDLKKGDPETWNAEK